MKNRTTDVVMPEKEWARGGSGDGVGVSVGGKGGAEGLWAASDF